MKTINWKCALYVILVIATITSLITWLVTDQTWGLKLIMESISKSVMVISFVSALFYTFLWKMKIFRSWFVRIPNLNGKWIGTIESDWINPNTQERVAPIHTELVIKQSLFKISCIMKTGETRSDSIIADFNIDVDNQRYQLVYIYMSIPKQNFQGHSPMHYGAIIFDLEKNFNVDNMTGNYWTGRKTGGFISVKKEA